MSEIEEIERRIELKEQELFLFVAKKYEEIVELREQLKERKRNISREKLNPTLKAA